MYETASRGIPGAVVAALALLGAGAACGGDDGAAGAETAEFCQAWVELPQPGLEDEDVDLFEDGSEGLEQLEEVVATAPEPVRSELEQIVSIFEEANEIGQDIGDDPEASDAAFEQVADLMEELEEPVTVVHTYLVEECGMAPEETGMHHPGMDQVGAEDAPDLAEGEPVPVEAFGTLCDRFVDLVTDLYGEEPESIQFDDEAPTRNYSGEVDQQNCRYRYEGDDWPRDQHAIYLQVAFGATPDELHEHALNYTGQHDRDELLATAEELSLGDEAYLSVNMMGNATHQVLIDDLVASIYVELPSFDPELEVTEEELADAMAALLEALEW